MSHVSFFSIFLRHSTTLIVTIGVLCSCALASEQAPRINELLSSNDNGIQDEDGEHRDWIELYNPNPHPVDASQYAISDDPSLIDRWPIPAGTSIPANGYLLIFASGKDRPTSPLHADFKLDQDGEFLALIRVSTNTLVHQLPPDYPVSDTIPELKTDHSFGYNPEGALRFFSTPTPGAPNGEGVSGYVKDTRFSHDRGFHQNPFNLTISSKTDGASIRYTTDGSEPSAEHGTLFSSPIPIASTTVIRAIAYKDGHAPTNIDTQTYLFDSDLVNSPVMDSSITQNPAYAPLMTESIRALPVISLAIEDPDNVDNDTENKTSVELLFADGTQGFQLDAGIAHFGGNFTNFDKKNFRLYFRKQYGAGSLKYPLFKGFENGFRTVETFDALNLRSGSHDMKLRGAYLSNRFTDDTMLEMGHLNPHGRFVHLMINGVYWGQYHLRERWQAAMAAAYHGGDEEDYEAINGNYNANGWSPGDPYDGDGSGWETIKSIAAAGTPWQSLQSRVDMTQYIDWSLMYNFGNSECEYRALLEPVENGLGLQTFLNDADGYLGLHRTNSNNPPGGPGRILGYLDEQAHPDYLIFIADRIYKHLYHQGALSPEKTIARLQRRVDETQLSFLCESARWGYRTPTSWLDYQNNLITNQLPAQTALRLQKYKNRGWYPDIDPPEFNQNGGIVAPGFGIDISSSSGGTVYYTTDGSDPRLPGGAINPSATGILGTPPGYETLIAPGSHWKYLDNGSNQESAWRQPDFDDSTWSTGQAELGYGDGDETTVVSYGDNSSQKPITTYFRKSIQLSEVTGFQQLTLNLQRDDGAVVFLNGHEVARSNMPSGDILYTTKASSAIGSQAEQAFHQFIVSPEHLLEGHNVIAVEIHQNKASSSDISFELNLSGTRHTNPRPDLILENDTLLQTRTLSDGEWSALHPAHFIVTTPPLSPTRGDLVVSELHYHPSNPTSAELQQLPHLEDDDFEFLEIMNVSDHSIMLDNASFTDGIEFTFPEDSILRPGERIILAGHAEAYQLRYPDATPPLGIYQGGLKNSGEHITLESPQAAILIDFSYADGTDLGQPSDTWWPSSADGDGHSLVLIHPFGNQSPDNPLHWRPSQHSNGSPGSNDALTFIASEDLDHDGSIALLERTLNSSDQNTRQDPNPVASLDFVDHPLLPQPGQYMTLKLTRNPLVESSLSVQTSENLEHWPDNAILIDRQPHENGTESLLFCFPEPYHGNQQFMRVHVSQ